jgi:NAD(P)-dependent dehydrogenase (short-subunit alcohol dehydrogenase family)
MVVMAKYCIPEMKKNEGQWRGSIVNIASVAGIRGGTPHLLYPTSKGAVVVSLYLMFFGGFMICWWLTGCDRI